MCPGSKLDMEAVKRAAAGAADLLVKRQKFTLTRLPDIGQHILSESCPDSVWFENTLAGTASGLTFCNHILQRI